jgi:sugar lactone lactonase YvrE
VLLRNLSRAVGLAVSPDGSFLLVSEAIGNRIRRYWLTGPRANTAEIFLSNINVVRPQNIKRTPSGSFWIAAASVKQDSQTLVSIRIRVDGSGRITEMASLEGQYGSCHRDNFSSQS